MDSALYIHLLVAVTGLLQPVTAGVPQRVKISGPVEVTAGVGVVYECSAVCTGVCNYSWNVDGRSINGNTFTLTADGVSTSVTVSCTVADQEQKHFASEVISVSVINPISVNPSRDQPVINREPRVGRSFKLTCDGASPPVTIIWIKGGELLTLNSRMSLSPDNTTLSFSVLEEKDNGQFRCKVLNGSSTITSKDYWIYFGFVRVIVSGPSLVEVGFESEFTCRAECGVDCTVQWALHSGVPKGRFVAEGPMIHWTPPEVGQTQILTCLALNSALGKLGQVSYTVTVKEARPRPRPSSAITARPSVAALVGASALMLVSVLA